MPEKLDPTAVHAIPGKGGTSAFVEPTARPLAVGSSDLISQGWRISAAFHGESHIYYTSKAEPIQDLVMA